MTDAMIGYNSTYEIYYLGSYVTVGEVTNITPGDATTDRVDATHMKSPGRRREKISGLIDSGEGSLDINWIPGNGTDTMLRALQTSGDNVNHKITFPNAKTVIFEASIMSVSKAIPIDDKMSASIGVSISGAETWGDAAVPTNLVLPAIIGTPQQGVELTGYVGEWAGSPNSFTFKWYTAGGSAIVGATAVTYTPVVGDLSSGLEFEATPINSAGAGAPAKSGPSADVIAP